MEPIKLFKEKLGGELSKKIFSSPYTYQLAKFLFVSKSPYEFKGLNELTSLGLDLTAQAYKEKQPTIFTTAFFPEELVYAFDGTPFAPEVAAATATSLELSPELLKEAEKSGFSRDVCSFHRVAAAGVPQDYFPQPDLFLASSHLCDGAPQLFRYLSQHYNKPYFILDVPANNDEAALKYVTEQLELLVAFMEKVFEKPLDHEKLNKIIEYSNQARENQLIFNETRKSYPGVLSGEQAIALVYLHFLCEGLAKTPEIYAALTKEIKEKYYQNTDTSYWQSNKPKILWSHLRPFFPNEIFNILEKELHVDIVFEEMNHVYWPPLEPDKPLESIAQKVLSHPLVGPIKKRTNTLLDLIDTFQADGLIHFSHWGCRQAIGGVPYLNKFLKRHGVAFLNLDTDCVDQNNYFSGQIRTRLESFVEMITH